MKATMMWWTGSQLRRINRHTFLIAAIGLVPFIGMRAEARAIDVTSESIGARGDGRADDTARIQTAIDRYDRVYLPAGVYRVDPRLGLVLRSGTVLTGDGPFSTLILASLGGGTTEQLIAYGPGSIIRRRFSPTAPNEYVTNVRIADLSVIMTHPVDNVTPDEIQIGIDLRNITRSTVERVHVGNLPPPGSATPSRARTVYTSQGYGIVIGTVSSGDKAYAGGEANVIRDCEVWGAYKLVVLDDEDLSPNSGAHATLMEHCDLQGGHYLLSQESRYGSGNNWQNLILQNIVPQAGNHGPTFGVRIEGSENVLDAYVELGPSRLFAAALGQDSHDNEVRLGRDGDDVRGMIRDLGRRNVVLPVKPRRS